MLLSCRCVCVFFRLLSSPIYSVYQKFTFIISSMPIRGIKDHTAINHISSKLLNVLFFVLLSSHWLTGRIITFQSLPQLQHHFSGNLILSKKCNWNRHWDKLDYRPNVSRTWRCAASPLAITMKIMILLMSSKINLASTLNLKMFTNNLYYKGRNILWKLSDEK